MSESLYVSFEVDVEATVDSSAFQILTAALLEGLHSEGLFPESLSVTRAAGAPDSPATGSGIEDVGEGT